MKRILKEICCVLIICLMTAACGNMSSAQNPDDLSNDLASSDTVPEEPVLVLRSDFITQPGNVVKTWEKDYDSSEWTDGTLITIYVDFPQDDSNNIRMIEEEANHYLHELGKEYYLHFAMPTTQEFIAGHESDTDIIKNREDGAFVDIYMTLDYKTAVEQGEILSLTEYLQSSEGEALYLSFDEMVWEQLRDDKGDIYGVPCNPIAAKRLVYVYFPQLAELLSVNMQDFTGDLGELESRFPEMLEQEVIPMLLSPGDCLLLSNFGVETYGDIFAVRHDVETRETVNLFHDDEIMGFYEQLGRWRDAGYITYSEELLRRLGLSEEEIREEREKHPYEYIFLGVYETGQSSFGYFFNTPKGTITAAFYVPLVQSYITENVNHNIMVINMETESPEACKELVTLLKTDDMLKRLLYSGIENCHYMWQDGKIVYETAGLAVGLGYEYDRSFLSGEEKERFTKEFDDMNQGVSYALSYYRPCDFAGTDLEDKYQTCQKLFEENWLVFLGYYGAETAERLKELEKQLVEAGYLELIESINAD